MDTNQIVKELQEKLLKENKILVAYKSIKRKGEKTFIYEVFIATEVYRDENYADYDISFDDAIAYGKSKSGHEFRAVSPSSFYCAYCGRTPFASKNIALLQQNMKWNGKRVKQYYKYPELYIEEV
ncbi:MAG: hypothetical protein LIP09_14160 [Bacteroidales bacterium]|nr:hypothetical protein [Bacteroidales bacterium]MCC8119872.1 hypothetical protein [Bacteroidales bacterium]